LHKVAKACTHITETAGALEKTGKDVEKAEGDSGGESERREGAGALFSLESGLGGQWERLVRLVLRQREE